MRELYDVVNLRLVDVRKYNGVEDGCQSWTFLGYDVVKLDKPTSGLIDADSIIITFTYTKKNFTYTKSTSATDTCSKIRPQA